MLEIKNVEVFGLERALAASGNPMTLGPIYTIRKNRNEYVNFIKPYEENDNLKSEFERGKKLGTAKASSGHDNFLSGILVQFDVKYPLYWSPEFQRYHFAQIISSQSTMHRLTTSASSKDFNGMFNEYVSPQIIDIIKIYSEQYNHLQEFRLSEEDCLYWHPDEEVRFSDVQFSKEVYKAFMKLRSNLPSGYEMWMTVSTNYLQLKTIYNQRKNHKLKQDWGAFCDMCLNLSLFKELTGVEK